MPKRTILRRVGALTAALALTLALSGCGPIIRFAVDLAGGLDSDDISNTENSAVITPEMRQLIGGWEGYSETFEFFEDGWATLTDTDGVYNWEYTAAGNVLTLLTADGDVDYLYEIDSDGVLSIYFEEQYTRGEDTNGYGLIGSWSNKEDDYSYIFNADGTYFETDYLDSYAGEFMVINDHVTLVVDGYEDVRCIFAVDDDELTLHYPQWVLTRAEDTAA